jgi:hypothetical protein
MAITISLSVESLVSSVSTLCADTHVDSSKLINAINSALGEMSHDESSGGAKAVMAWKQGTKNKAESFRLKEAIVNYYQGGGSNALRCYYFIQEVARIEKTTGKLSLAGWPEYLENWIKKFQTPAIEKAA